MMFETVKRTRAAGRSTTKGIDDIIQAYLAPTPLAHAIFRAAELGPILPLDLQSPVLEVGCGTGQFARFAVEGRLEAGVDLSARCVRRARASGAYGRVECADGHRLPFESGEFQTALCISVLEHVTEPEGVVDEMFRVLRPGGRAVVTIALADLHKHLLFPRLAKRLRLPALGRLYCRAQDWAFHHVTLLDAVEWERMFEEAGFRLVRSRRCISPRAVRWWDLLLAPALPYRLADALGIRVIWRPWWLCRIIARRIARLAEEDDSEGACLALLAEKPREIEPVSGDCSGPRRRRRMRTEAAK